MTSTFLRASMLAVALFGPGLAWAQSTDDAARRKDLDAARQDLQRAARRVAELSQPADLVPPAIHLTRTMSRPRLGVLLDTDDDDGVRITGITPDSGAARAGLEAGDRLLKIAGSPIRGDSGDARLQSARAALANLQADAPIDVEYERDGRTQRTRVTPARISPRVAEAVRMPGTTRVISVPGDGHGMPWVEGVPVPLDELRLGIAPELQRELRRLGRLEDCDGEDCQLPLLADAFRWSDLNLASVDAQLGRYFGADTGVLVLSAGDALEGLQPGDVIRSIEGTPVASPRDVMRALRAAPDGGKVAVDYLRDRHPGTASIVVPDKAPLRLPLPALSSTPRAHPVAQPQPVVKRRSVLIDSDGNVQTLEDDDTPPPADGGTPY